MKHIIAVAAAFVMVGAGPAPANWVNTITIGANGALVMGKPNAKVRLVEYISYSCSHCAHFVGEAAVPLKRDYVAKGLVAVEFRNAVRDQFDFTAALVARCGAATRFHGNTELLMATQGQWLGKANDFLQANGKRLAKLPVEAQLKAVMRGIGLDKIMAARGYTPAQLDVCIADKPNQSRLLAMTKEAFETRQISGTPSFLINGTMLENAGSWAIVEPSIKTALSVQ
jgi:protein-disulfide isomerase